MSSPFSQDLDVVFEGFDANFNNDLEKGRELRKSSEAKRNISEQSDVTYSFVRGADGVQAVRIGSHIVPSSSLGHRGVLLRCFSLVRCASHSSAPSTQGEYMQQAITALAEAESKARSQIKTAKSAKSETRFPAGTEWEVVQADALLLQGLTQGLNESYMGYLSCLWVSDAD